MTRVLERLDEIYAIGAHRAGYSREEDAAHELAARWMREAGLDVTRDAAKNLLGRRGDARVWSGSHLDSVPDGGRFDGVLGVVAAIESASRLADAPLAVVAFRAEETGPMGSRALEGLPDAFVELHIEQGPVLESAGEPLGVVTAIARTRPTSCRGGSRCRSTRARPTPSGSIGSSPRSASSRPGASSRSR